MAAAKRVAGTTFWIGTTATTGSSDTYTQITGARQIGGDLGGGFAVADSTTTDDLYKQESKTLGDAGTVDLEMLENQADTGQGALEDAKDDVADVPYNFEVRYPDGAKRRFKAKVITFQPMVGAAAALRMVRSRISLTAPATYVAAA